MIDTLLAGSVGFFSVTPGLAIAHLGGVGVQPIVPSLLAYIALLPISRTPLPTQTTIWILLSLVAAALATITSLSPAVSAKYLLLQGLYVVTAGVAFAGLVGNPRHRRAFLTGYLAAAMISSVAAIVQATYTIAGGEPIGLANNANFLLVAPPGRGAAFTPEPSVLAALLIPALLVSWFEIRAPDSALAGCMRGRAIFLLILLGLLATRSSSMIALPFLLIIAEIFHGRSWPERGRAIVRVGVLVAVVAVAFAMLYGARLENAQAQNSGEWRLAKIAAGLKVFAAHPLLGVGIGIISDADFFEGYIDIPDALAWSTEPRKGVDSAIVRALAETGIVGFALTYYPLAAFFSRARELARSPPFRALGMLSIGLLLSQLILSGYRDLPIFLLPLAAFAARGGPRPAAERRRVDDAPPFRAPRPSLGAPRWTLSR